MKKYAIWNKIDPIFTPNGRVFTAEQWIERYPIAGFDSVTVICADDEINGALFDTLNSMVKRLERQGCDFSACSTPEEKLAVIEAFEDEQEAIAKANAAEKAETEAVNAEITATSLASIAASLEYQNLMSLPDEEVI